jgi:hypothetical protein
MDKPLPKSALAERIDAVDFDVNRPWHDAGQPPLVFSYKFETVAADDFPWTGRVSGLSTWSAVKQDTIRDVLAEYATVINLEFVERPAFTDPDFSFYLAFNGVAGGLARFDYSGDDWDGSAAFNASRALDLSDRWIVLHEIGHTLGLKHTGDYDAAGFTPPPPFLPPDEDNGRYSVMSYNNDDATFGVIDSLGVYDIAALQARFGANMHHNTGNDRYGDPGAGNFRTIWDAGGRDTLFARDALAPVDLDLRGGTRSDFATGGAVVIAYGAQIENAVGGAAADVLTGNAGANRMTGKGGDDRLIGGRGADRLPCLAAMARICSRAARATTR